MQLGVNNVDVKLAQQADGSAALCPESVFGNSPMQPAGGWALKDHIRMAWPPTRRAACRARVRSHAYVWVWYLQTARDGQE